eukprot:g70603.t1
MSLIPPENFGMVEAGLYRSALPSELNFPFLETLHLKKILYLSADPPSKRLLSFTQDQEVEIIHLGKSPSTTATSPWKPVSEDIVIAALKIMLERESYPLLMMDRRGRHVTGTVVGCLRKVQRWNLASILAEYRRYADRRVRVMNEQFIELFDTDLVTIPPNPASCIYPSLVRTFSSEGPSAGGAAGSSSSSSGTASGPSAGGTNAPSSANMLGRNNGNASASTAGSSSAGGPMGSRTGSVAQLHEQKDQKSYSFAAKSSSSASLPSRSQSASLPPDTYKTSNSFPSPLPPDQYLSASQYLLPPSRNSSTGSLSSGSMPSNTSHLTVGRSDL